MGTVIRFPDERRLAWSSAAAAAAGPASIVILPVIRIERQSDEPSGGIAPQAGTPGGGRGRGRARRS